jgi:phage terminase small subunit
LRPQRARFVAEYLVDLNGTQAAIRAGYSHRTAAVMACELLRAPNVAASIDAELQARIDRTRVTADRVVEELAKLGFANMADYMRAGPGGDPYLDFSALTRDQAAALQEVTVEDYVDGRGEDARDVKRVRFKLADKRAALVDLGRHLGMFTERHEHTGAGGGPVQVDVTVRVEQARQELDRIFGGDGLVIAHEPADEAPARETDR